MRLIDANKVKQYILTEGFYCDTEADRKATAEEIDKLFPTVDAIPIEWIENHIKQLSDIADGFDKASLSYFLSNVKLDTLKDMLKDWEK